MKLNNLLARSITGLVYIAIVLAGILTNSVLVLGLVFGAFAAQANFEFQSVVGINRKRLMLKIIHALATILLFYIVYASTLITMTRREMLIAVLPYLGYYLFYLIAEMYRNRERAIIEVALAFFGHLYIALPLGMLMLLCADHNIVSEEHTSMTHTFWLLPIFVFVWLNDTGAFIVGSLMGKHKLFERISPKKTIEGFVGGVIFTMIGAWVFHLIYPGVTSLWSWWAIAAVVAIFSTWGDLFESYIKRTYGVKDSGNILPGHGGILDRIDSILFAAIPAYMLINIMVYIV